MKGARPKRTRRSRGEIMLAKYEALDPESLTPEERRFREFAIRALTIDRALKAKGPIGEVGSPSPPRAAPDRGRTRARRRRD